MMPSSSPNHSSGVPAALARSVEKYEIRGDALALLRDGWAIAGAGPRGQGAWFVLPSGRVHIVASGVHVLALVRGMRDVAGPVCRVNLSGVVCDRLPDALVKAAFVSAHANLWRESAYRGVAARPGKERAERLAIAAKLAILAGATTAEVRMLVFNAPDATKPADGLRFGGSN